MPATEPHTPAQDEPRGRKSGQLPFDETSGLTGVLEASLAIELDEYEQRPARAAERDARCSFDKRVFTGRELTPARDD